MRVALVCDRFLPRLGGIELHLRDLGLALRARGVDARVVTTTAGPTEVDGLPVHRIDSRRLPGEGVAISPRAFQALARTLETERFDVVHAHASVVSPAAYAGALAAARVGLPALITFHSMLHRMSVLLGASEALTGWSGNRIVLSAVSSVVALQAARWMPAANVAVLPNGIDATFWRALTPAPADDEIVVVSAMRLSRKKRALSLVRAFADAARFVAGTPPMRLVIAGEGPDRAAILRYAMELGVADRVALPGQLSRESLRALYATAHLFVLPSERESFGIAALEARAAGLPVVARLASGARDFITPGEHGLLARDDVELSRFIARFALDGSLRRYVAHQNARTPPPYDWADVARSHLNLYGVAAALRRGTPRASQA